MNKQCIQPDKMIGVSTNLLTTPTTKHKYGLLWQRYLNEPTTFLNNVLSNGSSSMFFSEFALTSMGVIAGLHPNIFNLFKISLMYFC